MTLVVAQHSQGAFRIVSDTKLSFEDAIHFRPLEHGALKCLVISSFCCVGFAGNVLTAENALKPLVRGTGWGTNQVLQHLLEAHQQSNEDTEFIVADASTDGGLHRIFGGTLEAQSLNAWIGDSAAFECYQQHYHSAQEFPYPEDHLGLLQRMRNALRGVIDDPLVPTVGGFEVSVTSGFNNSRDFKYLSYATGSGFKSVGNSDTPTSIVESVGAAGGSFNFTVLTPKRKQATQSGIGIYIREAKIGVLYCPNSDWTPILSRNTTCEEFISEVHRKFDLELTGVLLS